MKIIRWMCAILIWILLWLFISSSYSNDFLLDYLMNWKNDFSSDNSVKKYDRFEEIDQVLKKQYYDYSGINHDDMIENAVKAYVDWIWDPYTVYMDADTNSGFMWDLEWETNFEWIWAVVSKKDYYILIEELIKDAPAYKAWILPLDRIIKVDWEFVKDETLDESVSRMRWPKWTSVNVTVERVKTWDDSDILDITINRDSVSVPSLTTDILAVWTKKIWYIEMSMIWEETDNILKKEIPNLVDAKLDGIIIDVRWNWWGLMNIAVELASHFIPKWKLVVQSKYSWFPDEIYNSKWYWEFEWMKLVVLVDGLTASAWEIIALALQEQANATILWTTTFGKWTIQTLHDFDDWSSLKYTIWKWFPPSGISIDQVWISPDIVVAFDMDGYISNETDNQLEEAKNLFK